MGSTVMCAFCVNASSEKRAVLSVLLWNLERVPLQLFFRRRVGAYSSSYKLCVKGLLSVAVTFGSSVVSDKVLEVKFS